jgi:hypothetical protein
MNKLDNQLEDFASIPVPEHIRYRGLSIAMVTAVMVFGASSLGAQIILYGGIYDSSVDLDLEAQLELTKKNATLRFFSVQNHTHNMNEARDFIEKRI